jgi:hypothetical protein
LQATTIGADLSSKPAHDVTSLKARQSAVGMTDAASS